MPRSKNKKTAGVSSDNDDSHPVYSDFAYLGPNIGNLVFAVGLREDSSQAKHVVDRILPLRKSQPKPILEKVVQKKKVEVDEICMRADCAAKRERLAESLNENEHLRSQLKSLENRVQAAKNKLGILEKTVAITEEKNENVQGMIDETQSRISTLEVEVSRGEITNESLKTKLVQLQQEIEILKQNTEQHDEQIQSISHKAVQKVIFSTRKHDELHEEDVKLVQEVRELEIRQSLSGKYKSGEDYDSDDDRN